MRGMRRLLVGVSVAVVAGIVLSACATIINGTSQSVSIASQPTGAQVTVDGIPMGVTPVAPDLKRKDKHLIRIEMEGYEPFELQLNRSVSGWIAGNIIFGGLIGLAVDAMTGAMYKISPNEVMAVLQNGGSAQLYESGEVLLVNVVLEPNPSWEYVGTMTPVGR